MSPERRRAGLRLEVWRSSENQSEVHAFEGERYVLGWNPALFDASVIRELLVSIGYEAEQVERAARLVA